MKIHVFLGIALLMIVALGSALFFNNFSFEKKEFFTQNPAHLQEQVIEKSLILSFPINNTQEYLDGEVYIDGVIYAKTSQGMLSLKNFSRFPSNVSLKINAYTINYRIPETFSELKEIHLIVSEEEYAKYKRYLSLSTQDSFSQARDEHWNHMPLTYFTNFSEYNSQIKNSKELKVRYALERLHNAVPTVSFEKAAKEESADIVFKGEIPPKVRESTRPDGNFNTAGLAFHTLIGNIIVKGTVYLPLPTEGEECPSSDIALHELLHTFGLDHSTNIKSVLWDTASCTNNEIIPKDIAFLKGIYG
ncbi:MAG: matrixin family metalloprotease [Nanoarchaeota archaeon]